MDKIIVIFSGIFLSLFTLYFFFFKRETVMMTDGESIDILVSGGYRPDKIETPKGKTLKLVFQRKDENRCLEEVVLPDFKIRKFLPLNEKTVIEIKPEKSGVYNFECGMGMYHGRLIVK